MLEERGKWPVEGLVLECKDCKEKNNDLSRVFCCARRVMSLEPDFLAQKGAVEEFEVLPKDICVKIVIILSKVYKKQS